MLETLGRSALEDLVERGFTRRGVLRVAALLGAGATLPFGSEHALAQLSDVGRIPDDAVKINANEFPEGPSERALAALAAVAKNGNRCACRSSRMRHTICRRCWRPPSGSRPGLFYVCNPNNPTGTVTPRPEIEALIAAKPKDSVVLLDEAYIHFSDEPPARIWCAPGRTSSRCGRSRRSTAWPACEPASR